MTDIEQGAEVLRVLRAVRSVRDLRPDRIPDAVLMGILETARWTGSGMNRQPWVFLVVRDRAALTAIAEASPTAAHVANAGAAILLVMDGEMPELTSFDEGRAAERILIAATAQGIASAIGWIAPAGRPVVRDLLGIPEEKRVRTVVALGAATEAGARPKSAPGTARKALDEVVRWERYA